MEDKKELSEQDIRSKYITPAIINAGWDLHSQIREEYRLRQGRIIVSGKAVKRGKQRPADYLLSFKQGLPLAIVEAKNNNYPIGHGMQQALEYAAMLDIKFAFSSNGDGFLFHDKTNSTNPETELSMADFPSPEDLYHKYLAHKGLSKEEERVATSDFFDEPDYKDVRYYQMVAINRAVEAVAKGRKRLLLVMATGTGKTLVAFQIIWRLWKSGAKKRILFLADRNILVDQTKTNDFKAFGEKMHKISNRKVDPAYEIYLSLYQAITGDEEDKKIYKKFSADFFDLIIIDECHRGSAKEDSAWREILEYFQSATQIGMTATPKETKYISNSHYFGDPIYTYSLKQGINDGFLAPYKVVRVAIDKDIDGYRPVKGDLDKDGQEIPDKTYQQPDFDRQIVIDDRTQLVAEKIAEYMRNSGDRYMKTIVFCVDTEHAGRMRQALVNANGDLAADNRRYVVQITGDNNEGKRELDNFIDPESKFPVIATTSRLMSTGVDAQTCKLIVLDREVGSMTEFKQIIGRGTRLREDLGKHYFTILDFRRATDNFADPSFDGEAIVVYEPKADDELVEPDVVEPAPQADPGFDFPNELDGHEFAPDIEPQPTQKRDKVYVKGVDVQIIHEQVQYLDEGGRLITRDLRDYTRENILRNYASLEEFLTVWNAHERKQALVHELAGEGILLPELAEVVEGGHGMDPFDLVLHVAYHKQPVSRKERAQKLKQTKLFDGYTEKARAVINILIDKYADLGLEPLKTPNILKTPAFAGYGTPSELLAELGGPEGYDELINSISNKIYAVV